MVLLLVVTRQCRVQLNLGWLHFLRPMSPAAAVLHASHAAAANSGLLAAEMLANSRKKETGGRTGLGPPEQTALLEPAGAATEEVLCTLQCKGRGSCSYLTTYQQPLIFNKCSSDQRKISEMI